MKKTQFIVKAHKPAAYMCLFSFFISVFVSVKEKRKKEECIRAWKLFAMFDDEWVRFSFYGVLHTSVCARFFSLFERAVVIVWAVNTSEYIVHLIYFFSMCFVWFCCFFIHSFLVFDFFELFMFSAWLCWMSLFLSRCSNSMCVPHIINCGFRMLVYQY